MKSISLSNYICPKTMPPLTRLFKKFLAKRSLQQINYGYNFYERQSCKVARCYPSSLGVQRLLGRGCTLHRGYMIVGWCWITCSVIYIIGGLGHTSITAYQVGGKNSGEAIFHQNIFCHSHRKHGRRNFSSLAPEYSVDRVWWTTDTPTGMLAAQNNS